MKDPCKGCGFLNEYGYCECSSLDKWYACPIERSRKISRLYKKSLNGMERNQMTNEEVIKLLKYNSNIIHQTMNGQTDPNEVEALDMAIKALEQEPCEDAISRQAVLEMSVNGPIEPILNGDNKIVYRKVVFVDDIKALPPVLPVRPKGKWKRVSIDKYTQHAMFYYRCSECGGDIIGEHNFCPNCGADMRGEE